MFIATIVDFIRTHQDLAYGLALVAAMSEALPLIGVVVPGETIVLGISALAATGALHLIPLLISVTLGAVIGDGISYWLGHHYHRSIIDHWPLSRYPALIVRGEDFFRRHGGKSVFIARFTPGVRAILPLIAGTLSMSPTRFYILNVVSALAWGVSHVLVGVAVGASLVLAGAVAGRLMIVLIVLSVFAAAIVMATRIAVQRLPPLLTRLLERLGMWAQGRHGWFSRQLQSVLDPARTELPGLALLGALLVASLWAFMGIVQDVIAGDPLVRADVAVFQLLQGLRTGWIDRIVVAITELGDATVLLAVTFATLCWFAWRRNWRAVIYEVAAVGVASLFSILVKLTMHQSRPSIGYGGLDFFSFPSGHTTASTALFAFLAIIVAWEVRRRWQLAVTAGAGLLVGTIAFSRVYLGAHWLSDILAGITFGLAWASLLAIAYLRRSPPRAGAAGICASTIAGLLIVGTFHIQRQHANDMHRYAVQVKTQTLPLVWWWTGGWRTLPAHRIDLIGGIEEPLTFQWAGSLRTLKEELSQLGWAEPVPWSLRSTLAWLSPEPAILDLPVLPRLEGGHQEALVLVHSISGYPKERRLVLRLWRSNVVLARSVKRAKPLWIGSVSEEQRRHVAAILTIVQELKSYDGPLGVLVPAIRTHRLEMRGTASRKPGWDGSVLLGQAPPHSSSER
ncbi:MAG: VTT domain-containing protein [Alphaproteobacteria bacterium]|nr:VTT domain-containing protein [Alphaproteobacteria bacterium]